MHFSHFAHKGPGIPPHPPSDTLLSLPGTVQEKNPDSGEACCGIFWHLALPHESPWVPGRLYNCSCPLLFCRASPSFTSRPFLSCLLLFSALSNSPSSIIQDGDCWWGDSDAPYGHVRAKRPDRYLPGVFSLLINALPPPPYSPPFFVTPPFSFVFCFAPLVPPWTIEHNNSSKDPDSMAGVHCMTANQMLIAVSKERRFSPPFPLSLSLSLTLSPLVLLLNHSFLLLQGCTFRLSLFAYINAVHHSRCRRRGPPDRLSGFWQSRMARASCCATLTQKLFATSSRQQIYTWSLKPAFHTKVQYCGHSVTTLPFY